MERFCSGDASAFTVLFTRHGPSVRGYLWKLVRDGPLADDLTQTTFLSVTRARGRFIPGARFKPWLYAIATNGAQADWMCLLANTGEGAVHKNKSLICLPMKTKGVQVVKKLDKLGMRSSDTAQIFFDEVKVPVRNLIGQEGMGFAYQMQQFQEERLWGAISAVVGMERLIDQTVEYTRERKVFGRPLLDNQVIHFKLAEFRTEVELVRSLCYRACEEYLDGTDVTMLASMAKLKVGRLMRLVTDGCLQYWGGMGYMNETPISRAYRDMRLTSIGGGADEVMLSIICKLAGTLPKG